jgi:hypothetical protein
MGHLLAVAMWCDQAMDGTSPESRRYLNTLEKFSAASVFVLVLFTRVD